MSFFTNTRTILIVVGALIVLGIYFFARGENDEFQTVPVMRGDLVEEVDVTGRVQPTESVELGFEAGGRVGTAPVFVGDSVKKGQILVALVSSDVQAERKQAEADFKVEVAKLEELKRGTRQEDIDVQEVKVQNYEIALQDAKRNAIDKLEDAYAKADDGVRNKTDQFFTNPRSSDPKLSFTLSDANLTQFLETNRVLVEGALVSWRIGLNTLGIEDDILSYGKTAKTNLNLIKVLLERAGLALNSLSASPSVSQATIDGWKTDSSTARTNVSTAINNITVAEEKLRGAESNLSLARQELALKKSGSTPEEIRAQEARVQSAEAKIGTLDAQIAKTVLRAPFDGLVTEQTAKVGEIVSGNQSVVSLIGALQFEIEAHIPEADIAKIELGDPGVVTLDAYGRGELFEARVVAIDPAETVIEGVPTYKTTLTFEKRDDRIKSGMTANVNIITSEKKDILFVSQRAVSRKNGSTFVRIMRDGAPREILIEAGIRSTTGNVEILSGLNEGDLVVVSSGNE